MDAKIRLSEQTSKYFWTISSILLFAEISQLVNNLPFMILKQL